jgi:peroxiredoxin
MRLTSLIGNRKTFTGLTALLLIPSLAPAQEQAPGRTDPSAPQVVRPATAGESIQAIDDEYNQQLLQLERRRLARLSRLAAGQPPTQAAGSYEQLFRLAIGTNLFQEAEPAAETVIKAGGPSPTTVALAQLVKLIAEADRGAYEQSLETLKGVFDKADQAARAGTNRSVLQTGELLALCDAFQQRLLHGDQFAIATKAFQLALEHTHNPAIQEYLANHLKRLEMVGKPAPAIEGTDIDGKPFKLADAKGKVVLVIFWASWCLPSAAEVEWFQQAVEANHQRGLEVVGINVDPLQDGGQKLETVLPNIRRFLLDHNVRWPNLINGSGGKDFAGAYGVTEVPANVLIGRDGTIVHLDLVRKNLEPVIRRQLGP